MTGAEQNERTKQFGPYRQSICLTEYRRRAVRGICCASHNLCREVGDRGPSVFRQHAVSAASQCNHRREGSGLSYTPCSLCRESCEVSRGRGNERWVARAKGTGLRTIFHVPYNGEGTVDLDPCGRHDARATSKCDAHALQTSTGCVVKDRSRECSCSRMDSGQARLRATAEEGGGRRMVNIPQKLAPFYIAGDKTDLRPSCATDNFGFVPRQASGHSRTKPDRQTLGAACCGPAHNTGAPSNPRSFGRSLRVCFSSFSSPTRLFDVYRECTGYTTDRWHQSEKPTQAGYVESGRNGICSGFAK